MTEPTTFENLLVEQPVPGLARITINRPKVLNALNRATLGELGRCIDGLSAETRVVVVTGAGEKSFVAGADIAEMRAYGPPEAEAFSRLGHEVLAKLEDGDRVVIAEVNGFALGGGCELMLACDFAIAAENAKLGQPEVSLGVTAGFGGTTRLTRRVGAARARQLLYTGDVIVAKDALAMGLVNEVVPAAELRARVDAIVAKILSQSPLAVVRSKRSINVAAEVDLASANVFERQIFGLCFSSADQKEGMSAFVEKRKPAWTGR